MSRLAILRTKGYSWSGLRSLYAAIVREIEMQTTTWSGDWKDIEDLTLDPWDRVHQGDRNRNVTDKEVWFCRSFNSVGGCNLKDPHEAKVGRPPKKRKVKHICATCWIKDKSEKAHSETDEACPHKK